MIHQHSFTWATYISVAHSMPGSTRLNCWSNSVRLAPAKCPKSRYSSLDEWLWHRSLLDRRVCQHFDGRVCTQMCIAHVRLPSPAINRNVPCISESCYNRYAKKSTQMQHIFLIMGSPAVPRYRPIAYILESSCRADVKYRAYLTTLRLIGVWEAKNGLPETPFLTPHLQT